MAIVCKVHSQGPDPVNRIFGADQDYNGSVLALEDGTTLKHDTTTCSITHIDQEGTIMWSKDIRAFGCKLIYFGPLVEEEHDYDVLLQFEDMEVYILRSKTGKIKRLP